MQDIGRELYLFEGFALDLTRGSLRGADGEIELRPKNFELLRYLVQNAGRLISKDELINAVWPNVIVSDDSLAQCVSELRHALNDLDRRVLKTVPRRGYLFAAPVSSHKAAETTTRRLAAILAADVAGYSLLMGADEEETHGRLRAHLRELVDPKTAQHRGRIVKNTGDGFLAEFASVVDAVHCAVEIQRGMIDREAEVPKKRRIKFRIGINLGDVIVEDHDIFGDGVNVAARLEALAEPDGICVSRVVRDQVRDRLDYTLEDMGEQHVKNITRPVRVYRVKDGIPAMEEPSPAVPAALPLPDKPSIAVLPFTNMSSDPDQEYFADGIAEDIITALSRCPWLIVTPRNSSFAFRGQPVDLIQVSRDLGVRYVLEGSTRKAGHRLRLTAQLIDVESGAHVWAERYDRDVNEIFAVQDEISQAVSVAIAPTIVDAEIRRALGKPIGSLDAWAAYHRGLWHLSKCNADDNAFAQRFFQQAIELDPTFGGGYKGSSWAQCQAAFTLRTRDVSDALNSAEAFARHAVALNGADAEARCSFGFTLWLRGDRAGAEAEVGEALAMSPNLPSAHALLGATLIFSGRASEGIASIERAIQLDPHDPTLPNRLNHLAIGYYFNGEYDRSVEAANRAIRFNPEYPLPYRWLAAALGQLGRRTEAKGALDKALTKAPAVVDMYVRERVPWMRPQDHAHMVEGLRKAGWEADRETDIKPSVS
jgi:adenylate cyclase